MPFPKQYSEILSMNLDIPKSSACRKLRKKCWREVTIGTSELIFICLAALLCALFVAFLLMAAWG